jgi:hypothetical protein
VAAKIERLEDQVLIRLQLREDQALDVKGGVVRADGDTKSASHDEW